MQERHVMGMRIIHGERRYMTLKYIFNGILSIELCVNLKNVVNNPNISNNNIS